jgi:hypothetical protein
MRSGRGCPRSGKVAKPRIHHAGDVAVGDNGARVLCEVVPLAGEFRVDRLIHRDSVDRRHQAQAFCRRCSANAACSWSTERPRLGSACSA